MNQNAIQNPSWTDTQFPQQARPFNSNDRLNSSSSSMNFMDTIIEEHEEHEDNKDSSKDAEKSLTSIFEVYQKLIEKMRCEVISREKEHEVRKWFHVRMGF